jgi:hypothetical protein
MCTCLTEKIPADGSGKGAALAFVGAVRQALALAPPGPAGGRPATAGEAGKA